jgi:hypothetical protein
MISNNVAIDGLATSQYTETWWTGVWWRSVVQIIGSKYNRTILLKFFFRGMAVSEYPISEQCFIQLTLQLYCMESSMYAINKYFYCRKAQHDQHKHNLHYGSSRLKQPLKYLTLSTNTFW